MKSIFCFIALIYGLGLFSQEGITETKIDDPKYREDQFYVGISYNFLENKPSGMSQQGLSGGLHLGFVRDFPINEQRNIAFGIGLGYSNNSYNHNLYIKEENGSVTCQVLDNDVVGFSKNKLNIHVVEIPIQFRWRTSTAESYKFWRVYTGVKIGYVFNSIVKYKGGLGDFKQNNTPDLDRIRTTADISFGWGTWNFYVAYSLNSLFSDEATINGVAIDITEIKFGLLFYLF
ncbi:MAG: hypothetical protein COA88_02010 [Kordia sp.]|nr:MAG: hypothetical protein COA88_02010 [Kordia sp.]